MAHLKHAEDSKSSSQRACLKIKRTVPFDFLIETKLSDESPAKPLLKFQSILNVPAVQLVNKEGVFKFIKNGANTVLIVTAHRWLSQLP